MTSPQDVVCLLDVDITLLDNDRVIADPQRHLELEFGTASAARYWAIFEGFTLAPSLRFHHQRWSTFLRGKTIPMVGHEQKFGETKGCGQHAADQISHVYLSYGVNRRHVGAEPRA